MTKKEKKVFLKKIQNEISSLQKNIVELQKLCEPISPECSLGDLTRFELINDQEVSKIALAKAQVRSNKLQYALSSIYKNNFGLCMECEEEIPLERLLILPESTHCIECISSQNTKK